MKTYKENRIDITLRVGDSTQPPTPSEIGESYAFEFKNKNDYNRARSYLDNYGIYNDPMDLGGCNNMITFMKIKN